MALHLDEVAHDEPHHQDLCCLQIQPFSSLVVKELKLDSCHNMDLELGIILKRENPYSELLKVIQMR